MKKYSMGLATIHNNLRGFIRGRKRIQPWELQQKYMRKFGKMYSESAITARLREMKDVICFQDGVQHYYTMQS